MSERKGSGLWIAVVAIAAVSVILSYNWTGGPGPLSESTTIFVGLAAAIFAAVVVLLLRLGSRRRFCPSCGRSIPFDACLCPYCGRSLS